MRLRAPMMMVVLSGILLAPADVGAVPAFARKHEMACTQCHTAWPLLNRFGRTYKENGYRLDREKPPAPEPGVENGNEEVNAGDMLTLAKALPVSLRYQGRPVEKRNVDPRFRMRIAHEIEVQITGATSGPFSYYINLEGEDDPDWAMEVGDIVGGWHPVNQANVVGGYGTLAFADGYNAFTSRRTLQDRPTPVNTGFLSGYRFRDSTQFATFYGRAGGLYYSATVGTGHADTLGADRKDYLLRAAYDLPGGLSVGAFSLIGERALTAPTRTQDFNRTGFDLQYDSKMFAANALWYKADEDIATTLVPQENDAWYIQAHYMSPTKVPLVPTVRFESVQSNVGRDATTGATVGLIAYVRGNMNISVEHYWQTKAPPGRVKADRTSVLFMLGL